MLKVKRPTSLNQNQQGFSIIEVLVSLFVIVILIGVASTVIVSSGSVNRRTALTTDASEIVFDKIQDYINTDFDSLPIGLVGDGFEVEDFSAQAQAAGLKNADAKVYITPASTLDTSSTTVTETFTESVDTNSSFTGGGEINSVGQIDPGNQNRRDGRIRNNKYGSDYTYNRYIGSANHPLPAIDLGSVQSVDTIRIDWYYDQYASSNFRIEGNNSNSSSGWTTVVSGLTQTTSASSVGSNPQDIAVGGASYRYWRMYNVTGNDPNFVAISEMEAFLNGSGDIVEEADTGTLNFSSNDIDLTENNAGGQYTVGINFRNVPMDQAATIDSAYIQFTAAANDSGNVTVRTRAVDSSSPGTWADSNKPSDYNSSGATSAFEDTVFNSSNGWSIGDSGQDERVDVSSVVQELVNRGDWVNGDDMAFIISYVSGSGEREAEKSPVPRLVINWSTTTTVTGGSSPYEDLDGDSYADNPTLLSVRVVVDYTAFNETKRSEYSTYIRRNGVGY